MRAWAANRVQGNREKQRIQQNRVAPLDWEKMKDDEVRPEDLKPTVAPEFPLPFITTNKIKIDFTSFDCKMRQNVHSFLYVFDEGLLLYKPLWHWTRQLGEV